jgi:hypothetical protein
MNDQFLQCSFFAQFYDLHSLHQNERQSNHTNNK